MAETTLVNPGEIHLGRVTVLEGHTHTIWSVVIKDNLIISGSRDNTIKIWDIESGLCIKTLECHTNYIRSVAIKDNLIISSSYDNTISIWDIDSGMCIKTLESHTTCVMSVFVNDNLIISCADKTIKINPITLLPNESNKFQAVINSYWLPEYLELQLMDCFNPDKD